MAQPHLAEPIPALAVTPHAIAPSVSTLQQEIQQTVPLDPAEAAHLNLMYTANWVMFLGQAYLKQFEGVTLQQYNILRILRGQKGKPLSLLQVKSRMLDRNSDVSRIIDRMVRKGLIHREVCAADRRQVDLTISDKGLTVLHSIGDGKGMQPIIEGFRSLPPDTLERFNQMLDRIRAEVRAQTANTPCAAADDDSNADG